MSFENVSQASFKDTPACLEGNSNFSSFEKSKGNSDRYVMVVIVLVVAINML